MKFIAGLLGGMLIASLVACGGGSGQSFAPGPPPVQAQSGFSNSALTGTYGISFVGADVSGSSISMVGDGIGTVQFDGSGNVTGGSFTEYTSSGPCPFTLSGTYSVSSTGSIQATLTSSTTGANCSSSTAKYAGEVSQSGTMAVFAESDGTASGGGFLSGTAIKQQ